MKKFNVGEKVVALTTMTDKDTQPIKKGKIYKVLHISYCPGCGIQFVNVLGKHNHKFTEDECLSCGKITKSDNLYWSNSKHFARPSELQAELEQAEMEERYEDCADLVGIMAELEINKENVNH